ncbi:MAG TPA: hypothetical protein VMG31_09185 [Verrucomicrobiae bacterium]|nr:hypothetical protein [Verrucomicrobiae bacterium]
MTPEETQAGEAAAVSPAAALPSAAAIAEALSEEQALALLQNRDLPAEECERIAGNASLMKLRKVRLALAAHPRSPRPAALRLIRQLYTFDLMQFTLLPAAAADLKHLADELLVARLASLALGERISLGRRSSATVAAALLLDKEPQVWQPALENPRMTEVAIVKALQRPRATPAFVEAVSHHSKWSLRHEIRTALLRNSYTPMARALEFGRSLPPPVLRDVLHNSHLPEKIKEYLRKDLKTRKRN